MTNVLFVAIIVASIGFRPETLQVLVRPRIDTTVTVQLLEQATLTPVVVTATRVSRRLGDEPVRVEVLAPAPTGAAACAKRTTPSR